MRIEVISGPDSGRVFALDPPAECLIGRHARCDLRLADVEASRCHARITLETNRVFIDDMGSRNGTAVNGHIVRHAGLHEGDEILIGGSVLRLSNLAAPDPSPQLTTLHLVDPDVRVLASLSVKEADLISGTEPPPAEAHDTRRENRLLRNIGELSGRLVSTSETGVLQDVLARIRAAMEADSACVMLRDADDDDWQIHAAAGEAKQNTVRISRTIVRQAVAEGRAVLSDNPLADNRFESSESIVSNKIASAVCVPMKIDDAFLGVLFANRCNPARPLDALDLRFAATMANLLGVFIEKCRFQESLIKQERLAAVGQVIAGLAHYAKNIISGLRLSVSTMQRMVAKERYDMLGTVMLSVEEEERRLSDLVLDMLSYAKPREPVRMAVPVGKLLESVVRPYGEAMREQNIAFELQVAEDLPTVYAEQHALHRVFLNLVLNALDALKEREASGRALTIHAAPWDTDRGVEVRIRDTGQGIDPDVINKIFGVFFSTKGSKGTGLGLAVSRKLIEEHGGELRADSRVGEFTEFTVRIPTGATQA